MSNKGFPEGEKTTTLDAKAKTFASAAASDKWWESEPLANHTNLMSARHAQGAQEKARRLAEEVGAMYENPSPYKTQAANARDLSERFEKRRKEVTDAAERARKAADAEVEAAQNEIERTLPKQDGPRAAEIRSYFRDLPATERQQKMTEAIDAGDAETVAALTSAPGYLAGLDSDIQSKARQRFAERHAPEATGQLQAAQRAADLARQASTDAIECGLDHYPADQLKDAEARESKRAERIAQAEGDG